MCEHEYVALIPPGELKQLRALLRAIQRQRGWAIHELQQLDGAWARALAAARGPEGGQWPERCDASHLRPDALAALAAVVDRVFLAGTLQAWLAAAGRQPVGFRVVDDAPGPDDWISYFDDAANQIVLRRHRWGRACLDVSEQRPMSCEGVVCSSNLQVRVKGKLGDAARPCELRAPRPPPARSLPCRVLRLRSIMAFRVNLSISLSAPAAQVLARTIAHELVHALVYHRFPAMDATSEAYLPDERHGPIFKLLNRQLFGHSIDSLRPVFR